MYLWLRPSLATIDTQVPFLNQLRQIHHVIIDLKSHWHHQSVVPYSGTVATWYPLSRSTAGIMTLHSLNSYACSEHSLSRATFSTASELLNCPGFSFGNERWGAAGTIFTNSQSYCKPRSLLTSNSNTILFYQVNHEYEPASLSTHAALAPITKYKYYRWSVAEVVFWTNHIIERTFVHLHFSPLVRWSAVHPYSQTRKSLPLVPSKRQAHPRQGQGPYSALLHLREICCINPFVDVIDLLWSPLSLLCPCLRFCLQISSIGGFRARTGLAAFLFHI